MSCLKLKLKNSYSLNPYMSTSVKSAKCLKFKNVNSNEFKWLPVWSELLKSYQTVIISTNLVNTEEDCNLCFDNFTIKITVTILWFYWLIVGHFNWIERELMIDNAVNFRILMKGAAINWFNTNYTAWTLGESYQYSPNLMQMIIYANGPKALLHF